MHKHRMNALDYNPVQDGSLSNTHPSTYKEAHQLASLFYPHLDWSWQTNRLYDSMVLLF